jgi:hypothetical protein
MDGFRSWLTFKLVKLASQLHGEMFMRLCEVAVLAKHREAIEATLDALRLEQEHDYDYNHENEEHEHDTFH